MKFESRLSQLAALARQEVIPSTDCANAVVARLRGPYANPGYVLETPLLWVAGLSSVAAVAIVMVAVTLYHGAPVDPLREVIETISWASAP